MRSELERHYSAALIDADARGVGSRLRELESILQASVATINIDATLLRNMSLGQNYLSYYKALDLNLRQIAEQKYHAHRSAVDDKVHTGYGHFILNAALSPDGHGLTNYGPIALELSEVSISDRASVMRENAFKFYERHDLGRRNAEEETGWRSIWPDRGRLGAAHLCPEITPATAHDELHRLILFVGPTRHDDRYIEVHIYGELTWQSLSKIALEKPLTTSEDQEDWEFGRQKLSSRAIVVVDRVYA